MKQLKKILKPDFSQSSKDEWLDIIKSDINSDNLESLKTKLSSRIELDPIYNKEDLPEHNEVFRPENLNLDKEYTSWMSSFSLNLDLIKDEDILKVFKTAIDCDASCVEICTHRESFNTNLLSNIFQNDISFIVNSDKVEVINSILEEIPERKSNQFIGIDLNISKALGSFRSNSSEFLNSLNSINRDKKIVPVIETDYFAELGANAEDQSIILLGIFDALLNHQLSSKFESIIIKVSSEQNFFLNIAKIRAIRFLVSSILKLNDSRINVIYEFHTGDWNKSIFDANTNILRNTTEAFAAVCGACDILNVKGYESQIGKENDFSVRNALNISNLLKHESHLDKVSDIASGSYFLDNLTDKFAEIVWEGFQKMMEKGGIHTYINKELINEFKNNANENRDHFGKKRIKMIGTNVYPNTKDHFKYSDIVQVKENRLAARFEKLRLKVESLKDSKGMDKRPKVSLLKLGNSEMRFMRSGFSLNFLASLGLKFEDHNSMDDLKGEESIIVICSSDEEYIENGTEWISKLKSEYNSSILILAGNPENINELKKSGLDYSIHIKSNLEETLESILNRLGIE